MQIQPAWSRDVKHLDIQPPQIPKALKNRDKLKPIVKTVKNWWI